MRGNAQGNALVEAIRHLSAGVSLSADETSDAFDVIMRGEGTPAQIGALLIALAIKGETALEVAGGARALRTAMLPLDVDDFATLVDTCGTGGGSFSTFNISTAAALVAAGAGCASRSTAIARTAPAAAARTCSKRSASTSSRRTR